MFKTMHKTKPYNPRARAKRLPIPAHVKALATRNLSAQLQLGMPVCVPCIPGMTGL